MWIREPFRVCAFAWCLDLDVADEGVVYGDRVVGTCLELRERRLSNELHGARGQSGDLGKIADQGLKGTAKLIFGGTRDCRIGEFRLRGRAEV
jgi:hypothetical protein